MIDVGDKTYIQVNPSRKVPRYRCLCGKCGADRGYKDKTAAERMCRRCANIITAKTVHVGKTVSDDTRAKMRVSALARGTSVPVETPGRIYRVWNSEAQRRIKHNIRSLVWQKLKSKGATKTTKTFSALGYTPEELIRHLENSFQPGMTWDNYGKIWHIDHVKPDSWFSYSSIEDTNFKTSWSLENLQPLWARDNMVKGNRFGEPNEPINS